MDFLVLSWNKSHEYVHKLAEKIEQSEQEFDVIVAIARGGVTVGHMLSDFLALPLTTFTASTYKDFKKMDAPQITYKIETRFHDKKVLLVDELSDTGSTFEEGVKYMRELGARETKTAALFTREYTKFKPDFSVKEVHSWVVFPWDTRETIETLTRKWKEEGDSVDLIRTRLKQLKLPDKYIKSYLQRVV